MSVADSISAALLRFGRPMTLRRLPSTDVTVYGHSQGNAPASLVQTTTQGVSSVTISNKQIADNAWPGPPKNGDALLFDNRRTIIQSVEPKYLGSIVLVWELTVKG